MIPAGLPHEWRERAGLLRRYGAEAQAKTLEETAAELEAALTEAADVPLTLAEASRESGYSERRLRELVAEGKVPNAGERNRPRIRRGDLPRRGRRPTSSAYNPAEDAAAILSRLRAS